MSNEMVYNYSGKTKYMRSFRRTKEKTAICPPHLTEAVIQS